MGGENNVYETGVSLVAIICLKIFFAPKKLLETPPNSSQATQVDVVADTAAFGAV